MYMKRSLLILAMVFASSSIISAQEQADTTVVRKPDEVIIVNSSTSQSVRIKGSADDSDYTYFSEFEAGEKGSAYESENFGFLDFDLPFGETVKEKTRPSSNFRSSANFSAGVFKLYGGFMTSFNDNPYDFGYWDSHEWGFSILKYDSRKLGSFFQFCPSIGFGFKNFKPEEDIMYQKVDGGIGVEAVPENMSLKKSVVRVASVTAPLMFDFYSRRDRIGVQFGPVVNFNFHSKIKNVYTMGGGKEQKDKQMNIHATPVTVDYMAMLRFRSLGFYVKCSPHSVFDTSYNAGIKTITVGLLLN